MKRLCIIPARSGSEGVPEKNLIRINGESLAARAARCAVEAGIFDRVVISTDSREIAAEGVLGGAEAPFLRPASLATREAPVIEAILHAITTLEGQGSSHEIVALLEPTSPLRTQQVICDLVALVESTEADSGQTLSLVPDSYRAVKQMIIDASGFTSDVMSMPEGVYRRQDLPASYIRNGMAYVMTRNCVMAQRRIIGARNVGLVVDGPFVNIDWPEDVKRMRDLLGSASATVDTSYHRSGRDA